MSKLPIVFPPLEITDLSDVTRVRALMTAIVQMFQRVSAAFNNPDFGSTGARPTIQRTVGQTYFDSTLGKPIWWNGTVWVDSAGTPV
jgi:hypothetical protein